MRQLRRRRPAAGSTSSGGHEDRAHRQERVASPWRAATGRRPSRPRASAGRDALPVAGADVVDDDVARRRGPSPRRGVTRRARPADDDAELDLEVEGVGALGPDDRLAVGDDRVGELREQQRPVRRVAAALGDVVAVVQPDADDLAGTIAGPAPVDAMPARAALDASARRRRRSSASRRRGVPTVTVRRAIDGAVDAVDAAPIARPRR